ncbi:hypothetical protein Aple_040160 [Acrocarpospora pleiomorpha]|uniref:Uncharacterized protein n=1 Tax=Acrocarpospora pleiomorpha TaxID=90975 RepID=A0A5M3XJI4_9ACTN|nr:DUF6055 domain-containing protein [Acrocarpospora pleiomorpha]GES21120.1 hypothetical protein Aple_040160 [Acrocarpospora pleiomorpha]
MDRVPRRGWAMQVYPTVAVGDLTRFIRTEHLAYSSSRHHYGNWMLMQYIRQRRRAERSRGRVRGRTQRDTALQPGDRDDRQHA